MRWSEQDINFLKDNFSEGSKEFLLSKIDTSWSAITTQAYSLRLRRNGIFWSEQDINFLKDNYPKGDKNFLISKIGVSWDAIRLKASKLGLKMVQYRWLPKDITLLKLNYSKGDKDFLISQIGASWVAIKSQANSLGLKRGTVFWTPGKINFLELNYNKSNKDFLISKIGANWRAITYKANRLGLRRSVESKIESRLKSPNKGGNSSKIELSFLKNDILEVVDPQTRSQVQYPGTKFVLDYFSPKLDSYIEFNGDYWHGRNKTIAEMENSGSPQKRNIAQKMKNDLIKNKIIPNIITIWESDLKKAIKENKLNEFLEANFKLGYNTILFRDPLVNIISNLS